MNFMNPSMQNPGFGATYYSAITGQSQLGTGVSPFLPPGALAYFATGQQPFPPGALAYFATGQQPFPPGAVAYSAIGPQPLPPGAVSYSAAGQQPISPSAMQYFASGVNPFFGTLCVRPLSWPMIWLAALSARVLNFVSRRCNP